MTVETIPSIQAVQAVPNAGARTLPERPMLRMTWPEAEAAAGAPYLPLYQAAKRLLDLAAGGAILLLSLPLMLAIALAIRLDSPGPVLLRQERLGLRKQPFPMFKFRTMHVNTAGLSPALLSQNEATGPLFKMRRDPRVTRVGRVLRRTSMDELPQLLNIVRGEMSLVGPRPPLPRELAGYGLEQALRLAVVPGLTGLWQVSGRSNLTFGDMLRLDLEYIERRTIWLDLRILVKTLPSALKGEGAY